LTRAAKLIVENLPTLSTGDLLVRSCSWGKQLIAGRDYPDGSVVTVYSGDIRTLPLQRPVSTTHMRYVSGSRDEVIDGECVSAALVQQDPFGNWFPIIGHDMYDRVMYGGLGAMMSDPRGTHKRSNCRQVNIDYDKPGNRIMVYKTVSVVNKGEAFSIKYMNQESRSGFLVSAAVKPIRSLTLSDHHLPSRHGSRHLRQQAHVAYFP
jgi:hypothetical protein